MLLRSIGAIDCARTDEKSNRPSDTEGYFPSGVVGGRMTDSDSSDSERTRRTKVARLIPEYGLDGIGDELERRWTEPEGDRDSLRTLADVFNRRLLAETMTETGMDPIDGEVQNYYRLLTDDDVSQGIKTETEIRLRQAGIDVETLQKDFVTYQAIRTFLKEIRGVSHSTDTTSIESAQNSFDRLIGRATSVVEQKLQQFRSSGRLTLGTFQVRTSVTVYCEDCETQYDIKKLLNRNGCDCDRPSSD